MRVVTEVQVERIRPPAALTRSCPPPVLADAPTLGDVVRFGIEAKQVIVACNDQLELLRRSLEVDQQ